MPCSTHTYISNNDYVLERNYSTENLNYVPSYSCKLLLYNMSNCCRILIVSYLYCLENRCIDDVIYNFWFLCYIKQVGSILPIASCVTLLLLPHFEITCDLLLNRHRATWNLLLKQISFRCYNFPKKNKTIKTCRKISNLYAKRHNTA